MTGCELTLQTAPPPGEWSGMNSHEVFVADDLGIHAAFEKIKGNLANRQNNCISLVYILTGPLSHILFKAELESLERRFASQLLTYYVYSNGHDSHISFPGQQKMEIIVNSNTCRILSFNVLGREEHILNTTGSLLFLGIQPCQIQSQIFK